MIVGLISTDKGEIKIMGNDLSKEREKALKNLGAVVENPELYGYLSGRENLMQIARIRNISKERVDEVIELVGLKDRINDKVKKYSLGMKQRLGIGAALLSKPKLLILDEPTNGLDPSGILDFREIVKRFAKKEGTAVFISSHILSEVQNLCNKVAFVNHGVIKAVEHIGESDDESTEVISLNTNDMEKSERLLKELELVKNIKRSDKNLLLTIEKNKTPLIVEFLVKNNVEVNEVYKKNIGLEQMYMELVEGGVR